MIFHLTCHLATPLDGKDLSPPNSARSPASLSGKTLERLRSRRLIRHSSGEINPFRIANRTKPGILSIFNRRIN
jgi:hypothetical protein